MRDSDHADVGVHMATGVYAFTSTGIATIAHVTPAQQVVQTHVSNAVMGSVEPRYRAVAVTIDSPPPPQLHMAAEWSDDPVMKWLLGSALMRVMSLSCARQQYLDALEVIIVFNTKQKYCVSRAFMCVCVCVCVCVCMLSCVFCVQCD